MTTAEYIAFCRSICHSNEQSIVYGLGEEAGEVLGCYKRLERDLFGVKTEGWQAMLLAETGDLLYYLTVLLDMNGSSLDKCMEANVVKLTSRRDRGMLKGEGDNR